MNLQSERRWITQYAILTLVIFLPLFWSFRYIRNLYPFTAWNVMMESGDPVRGRSYYILRGETVSGEIIDLRAAKLTNALYARNWTMVNATVDNQAFKLTSLHPDNITLLSQVGGIQNLPPAERVTDLLEAWGKLYNDKQSATSPQRLKAVRLDMYRWESGRYSDYDNFLESWRKEL